MIRRAQPKRGEGASGLEAGSVERVARESYGKLIAQMAARTGDIQAAEDALADAFVKALEIWPAQCVPANPEAWLMTTARNKSIDVQRRMRRVDYRDSIEETIDAQQALEGSADPASGAVAADDRLNLMYVCTHPAIDPAIHTPLILQTVLGVHAEQIASAYRLKPATLAQRLTRAKRKILEARIPFDALADEQQDPARLQAILEAIYGAYSLEWMGDEPLQAISEFTGEAQYLSQLLVDQYPNNPEVLALAALIALLSARSNAVLNADHVLIPLHEQDTDAWDRALTDHGLELLQRASTAAAIGASRLGRFQLEASIQAVHAARRETGETDWRALAMLYAGVIALFPTLGAAVAQAAVVAEDVNPSEGLALLTRLDSTTVAGFQPYWATKAHLHRALGQRFEATDCYYRAIALCSFAPARRWLEQQLSELPRD